MNETSRLLPLLAAEILKDKERGKDVMGSVSSNCQEILRANYTNIFDVRTTSSSGMFNTVITLQSQPHKTIGVGSGFSKNAALSQAFESFARSHAKTVNLRKSMTGVSRSKDETEITHILRRNLSVDEKEHPVKRESTPPPLLREEKFRGDEEKSEVHKKEKKPDKLFALTEFSKDSLDLAEALSFNVEHLLCPGLHLIIKPRSAHSSLERFVKNFLKERDADCPVYVGSVTFDMKTAPKNAILITEIPASLTKVAASINGCPLHM
jgi:hypothetical protein